MIKARSSPIIFFSTCSTLPVLISYSYNTKHDWENEHTSTWQASTMINFSSCHFNDKAVRSPSERTTQSRSVITTYLSWEEGNRRSEDEDPWACNLRAFAVLYEWTRSWVIHLFWPWRARPVPFWLKGLRLDPLGITNREKSERNQREIKEKSKKTHLTSERVFTQCVPWRRLAN